MRILFLVFLLLISYKVECQIQPISFDECEIEEMFVKAEHEPQWACDTIGLVEYMNNYVKDPNLLKVNEGRIVIGILIYENGETCCFSFANLTKIELNPYAYKDAINQMPNWTPAKQGNKNITFLKQQIFNIRNGKFVSE